MRHVLLAVLLSTLAVLPMTGVVAAEGGGGGGGGAAKAGNVYAGEITKINGSANTIVVTGQGGSGEKKASANRVFSVDAKTVVSGVKAKSLNDLKVGQQVRVTHSPVEVAEQIEVLPGGGAKKKGG